MPRPALHRPTELEFQGLGPGESDAQGGWTHRIDLSHSTCTFKLPRDTPAGFLIESDKRILKFTWKFKGPREPNNFEKKSKDRGLTLAHVKLLQSRSNKDGVVLVSDRHISPWNRIGSLEVKPHIFGQLIFDTGAETTARGMSSLFSRRC